MFVEKVLTMLNAMKSYNDVNELKKEIKDVNEKSKKYLESSKEIVTQSEIIHKKEIESKNKRIKELLSEIQQQNDTIKALKEENEKNTRKLSRIPKFILFIFGRDR